MQVRSGKRVSVHQASIAGGPTDFGQNENAAQKCACTDSEFRGEQELPFHCYPRLAGTPDRPLGGFVFSTSGNFPSS
jgi:hypothetical protein